MEVDEGSYGDHFLSIFETKQGYGWGLKFQGAREQMGLSHPYTLSVSHDGGWRNTMYLFLGIIFILLSQNMILLLQKFAAASCYEKHPFEVAK